MRKLLLHFLMPAALLQTLAHGASFVTPPVGTGGGGGATNGIQMLNGSGTNTALLNPTLQVTATVSGDLTVSSNATVTGSFNLPSLPTNSIAVLDRFNNLTNATRRIYVETNQAPLLDSILAAQSSGTVVELGAGRFETGTDILDIPHGVHLVGQGKGVTIINSSNGDTAPTMTPGSGSYLAKFTLINRDGATNVFHQPFGTIGPTQGQKLFTNAIVDNVEIIGDAVAVYIETQLAEPTSIEFRNCTFFADHDGAFLLGPYSRLKVLNCNIRANLANATNLVALGNIGRTGRGFLVGEGATVEIINTEVMMENFLNPIGLFVDETLGGSESRTQYVAMANSPLFITPTNGGTAVPYYFNGNGTNASAVYQSMSPFPVSSSEGISTNPPGPTIMSMTATQARTNYLPFIAKGGWQRYPNLEVGVRDAAGTAGSASITVLALGGSTINGASSYAIDQNYGEAFFRADTSGTNWTVQTVSFSAAGVGTGDMFGPAAVTANQVVLFGGTGGDRTTNSPVTIDPVTGAVGGVGSLVTTGLVQTPSLIVTNPVPGSYPSAIDLKSTNGVNKATIQGAHEMSFDQLIIVGVLEKAAASVVELPYDRVSELMVTNPITAAITVVGTNGVAGRKGRFKIRADGTDRVFNYVPNTGQLVANMNSTNTAMATSYSETIMAGFDLEGDVAIDKIQGTNTHYLVTRQSKR